MFLPLVLKDFASKSSEKLFPSPPAQQGQTMRMEEHEDSFWVSLGWKMRGTMVFSFKAEKQLGTQRGKERVRSFMICTAEGRLLRHDLSASEMQL